MVKIKSYQEQLIEVQQAISDVVLGAQEASYNGQRVQKADLTALQERERWLLWKISRQKRGGIRVRGGTPI